MWDYFFCAVCFLSHKSYFKTEYFFAGIMEHCHSFLLAWKDQVCFFENEKSCSIRINWVTIMALFSLCSTTRGQIYCFVFLLVLSTKRLVKKINTQNKNRICNSFVLQCTEETFCHLFWNSWSRCCFWFMFNLKATLQMLKLLAISYNVFFRSLSFFEHRLNFHRKALLLLDFWWWDEDSESALPFAETIYIYFSPRKWWRHLFFTVISQEKPFH